MINIQSTRMLGAYGFLARLFDIFDKYKKSVDVISTSEVSVSLTINNNENIDNIARDLKGIADIQVINNKTVISLVGEGIGNTPGISGRTFTALGKNKINIEMISQASSGVNITFVVDGKDAESAIKFLHEEYFEN